MTSMHVKNHWVDLGTLRKIARWHGLRQNPTQKTPEVIPAGGAAVGLWKEKGTDIFKTEKQTNLSQKSTGYVC
jgi:hypothetical protein